MFIFYLDNVCKVQVAGVVVRRRSIGVQGLLGQKSVELKRANLVSNAQKNGKKEDEWAD